MPTPTTKVRAPIPFALIAAPRRTRYPLAPRARRLSRSRRGVALATHARAPGPAARGAVAVRHGRGPGRARRPRQLTVDGPRPGRVAADAAEHRRGHDGDQRHRRGAVG